MRRGGAGRRRGGGCMLIFASLQAQALRHLLYRWLTSGLPPTPSPPLEPRIPHPNAAAPPSNSKTMTRPLVLRSLALLPAPKPAGTVAAVGGWTSGPEPADQHANLHIIGCAVLAALKATIDDSVNGAATQVGTAALYLREAAAVLCMGHQADYAVDVHERLREWQRHAQARRGQQLPCRVRVCYQNLTCRTLSRACIQHPACAACAPPAAR